MTLTLTYSPTGQPRSFVSMAEYSAGGFNVVADTAGPFASVIQTSTSF